MKVYTSNILQKNPVSGRCILIKDSNDVDANIKNSEDYEQNKEAAKSFIDKTISHFGMIEKLKYKILPNMELYGDCFLEVINIDQWSKEETDINKADTYVGESVLDSKFTSKKSRQSSKYQSQNQKGYLTESEQLSIINKANKELSLFESSNSFSSSSSNNILNNTNILNNNNVEKLLDNIINEIANCFIEEPLEELQFMQELQRQNNNYEKVKLEPINDKQYDPKYCMRYIMEDSGQSKTIIDKILTKEDQTQSKQWNPNIDKEIDLDQIIMLTHAPSNIVILETDYGTRLGYVEIRSKKDPSVTNIGQQLSTLIGKMTTIGNKGSIPQEVILNKLVKIIIKKIIEKVEPQNKNKLQSGKPIDYESILKNLNPDVYKFIKKLLIETSQNDPKRTMLKKVQARFIPIKRMFQFSMPSSEYTPYGESINN